VSLGVQTHSQMRSLQKGRGIGRGEGTIEKKGEEYWKSSQKCESWDESQSGKVTEEKEEGI